MRYGWLHSGLVQCKSRYSRGEGTTAYLNWTCKVCFLSFVVCCFISQLVWLQSSSLSLSSDNPTCKHTDFLFVVIYSTSKGCQKNLFADTNPSNFCSVQSIS
ncbi:hypothetical protein L873DRAFT_1009264 [Choiromyces venosus 120613-1]|uniref:Uncharacterized protein n=1 Tax=Choiromyces venosus 120613-1 TaxID=1336337 RepID=A0A3N4JRF3_9PEZI|nr:hypothetical protein L873DRAFT_1009264 [Choiromyces venosus 120613-1]